MDRIPDSRWREPIGEALELVEPWRRVLGEFNFVCGVDPEFAGVHDRLGENDSNRWLAHCAYSHICSDGITTVVLPLPVPAVTVVHELGHVLHEKVSFEDLGTLPVSEYATTNRWERFAEYFVMQAYGHGGEFTDRGNEGWWVENYYRSQARYRLDALTNS